MHEVYNECLFLEKQNGEVKKVQVSGRFVAFGTFFILFNG
jgi:hypothetical protein